MTPTVMWCGRWTTKDTTLCSYDYDAFGVEQNPNPLDPNPFRYCGEYYEKSSGEYYLRSRNYAPATGRFMTEDPIRAATYELSNGQEVIDPLSLNLYTYCYNNPIVFTDPSGLTSVVHGEDSDIWEGLRSWLAETTEFDEDMYPTFDFDKIIKDWVVNSFASISGISLDVLQQVFENIKTVVSFIIVDDEVQSLPSNSGDIVNKFPGLAQFFKGAAETISFLSLFYNLVVTIYGKSENTFRQRVAKATIQLVSYGVSKAAGAGLTKLGASIGTSAGPIGTVVGAVVGAIASFGVSGLISYGAHYLYKKLDIN